MKYLIKHTRKHKEILDKAIHLALAWHYGDIGRVVNLIYKAYKSHNQNIEIEPEEFIYQYIKKRIQAIKNLDTDNVSFGKYDVLSSIRLSDKGESVLSESQATSLMILADRVSRLMTGQLRICFEMCKYSLDLGEKRQEFDELTASLHNVCWRMEHNAHYGIGYSEESNILWDIYQSFRYQDYLNSSDEEKRKFHWSVWSDKPMHTAKEPLIGIIVFHNKITSRQTCNRKKHNN